VGTDGESGEEVDETLLAELARLSPEERMRMNDSAIASILEMQDAFARLDRPARPAGRRQD
jgi:hypothetical protein